MIQQPAPYALVAPPGMVRRCAACDVTWAVQTRNACWHCGAPGTLTAYYNLDWRCPATWSAP